MGERWCVYVPSSSGTPELESRCLVLLESLDDNDDDKGLVMVVECVGGSERDVQKERDLLEGVKEEETRSLSVLLRLSPGREEVLDLDLFSILSPPGLRCLRAGAGAGLLVGLSAGGAGLPVLALLVSLSIRTWWLHM